MDIVNELEDVPWSLVNEKLTCQLRAFELIGQEAGEAAVKVMQTLYRFLSKNFWFLE